MQPEISVVIRTHNPRLDYFARTLAGLHAQTLSPTRWELVIVDNCSEPSIRSMTLPECPPHARIVEEPEMGITRASLKGFRETAGDVIVFLDDDNVSPPDFLEAHLAIASAWPRLGAWGAAKIEGEFERQPREEFTPLFKYLALRDSASDRWTNNPKDWSCIPFGAGLALRRCVAEVYTRHLTEDPRRAGLGRIGKGLGACEDLDMAMTATDAGMGFGIFRSLQLSHLIPERRVQPEYLFALVESIEQSEAMLRTIREGPPAHRSRLTKLLYWARVFRASPVERHVLQSKLRAYQHASKLLGEAKGGG